MRSPQNITNVDVKFAYYFIFKTSPLCPITEVSDFLLNSVYNVVVSRWLGWAPLRKWSLCDVCSVSESVYGSVIRGWWICGYEPIIT